MRTRLGLLSSGLVAGLLLASAGCTVSRGGGVDAAVDLDGRVTIPDTTIGDTNVTCDPGTINCSGACTRVVGDSNNCGSCGNVCPSGVSCALGECTCMAPQLSCGGTCMDVMANPLHCGSCDNACGSGAVCRAGVCECATSGAQMCDGACVDVQSDPNHCGGCGNVCTAGRTCVAGACRCPAGQGFCDGACIDVSADDTNCGSCHTTCLGETSCVSGVCSCPGTETSCGGTCVDTSTDPANCGACIASCGTGGTCAGGVCTSCGGGLTVCGGRCVDTTTSTLHCGGCNTTSSPHACVALAACVGGTCMCPASLTDCTTACADLDTSLQHCGACGHACLPGETCSGGTCQCAGMVCGAACLDTMTNSANCGACGHACVSPQVCVAGSCSCRTGLTACGPTCNDLTNDPAHCGDCATNCGLNGVCTAGVCHCGAGYTMCGSSCVNLQTSQQHCGDCTTVCGTGMACHAGVCELADSFRILTLGSTGCSVIDHETASGDDRGGVAVTASTFFVTGDTSTARIDAATLGGITAVGAVHDGMISNIDTEDVYVLLTASGTEVSNSSPSQMITQLGQLDPTTGALTSARIPLTTPIMVSYGTGIMSGYGEGLLGVPATGGIQWWQIELPAGTVTMLGTTQSPTHRTCENWAWWGIAERWAGAHYAAYVESYTQISRLSIPDTGMTSVTPTAIATFTDLGDMCSITFSTSRNRWYFHHEYESQFGGDTLGETAGYCPGTYDRP